jgi:hypothetical protein
MIEVNVRLTREMLLSIATKLAAQNCGLDLARTGEPNWTKLQLKEISPVWYGCEEYEQATECLASGSLIDEIQVTFRTDRQSWEEWLNDPSDWCSDCGVPPLQDHHADCELGLIEKGVQDEGAY